MGDLEIQTVASADLASIVHWIHGDLSAEDRRQRLTEAARRYQGESVHLPREILRADRSRMAAVYFLPLPGNVLTLGGLRCEPGGRALLIRLLRDYVQQLKQMQVPQIQAVVPSKKDDTLAILQDANFERLTTVKHLWRDIANLQSPISEVARTELPEDWAWRRANQLPFAELANIVCQTFRGTLDCPKLNGLRSNEEVLTGFLDGCPLSHAMGWELLYEGEQVVGCVFLHQHTSELSELSYIGLLPEYRGQGLGQLLISHAMERSRESGSSLLVAAVDQQNWPAMRIYRRLGFQPHQSFAVLLSDEPDFARKD